MSSLLHNVGLRRDNFSSLNAPATVPNYGPYFIMFQFVFAYGILSSRTLKQYYGIDHNASPREDLTKYGESAVKEGKITRKQLEMLKRNESAHAHAVENFAFFASSVLFASFAGVDRRVINRTALIYTIAKFCHAAVYILIDDPSWSQLRGITWWAGNLCGLTLLWMSGSALNSTSG